MYQEMKMEDAMKKFCAGRQVLVLECMSPKDGPKEYDVVDLRDLFSGSRFLVDVPAVIDQEFDIAAQDMVKNPPPLPPPIKQKMRNITPGERNGI